MVALRVVVWFAVLAAAAATDVQQCKGQSFNNLSDNVQLSCKSRPCRLKKGSNTLIEIKFTPENDIPNVINHVTAKVFGVDVPFVGVNEISICEKVYFDDGEKAFCPLKAGRTYTYKDSFPILQIYPSIDVMVHWALVDENKKNAICFEVPARIA